MRGLTQNKKRNSNRNETHAIWSAFQAAAHKTFQLKRVLREDLLTGEITESSRSKMNAEVRFWFETFCALKTVYALPQSVAWGAMERGAVLYTVTAKFRIENASPVPAAEKVENGEFYRTGEIELYYENVLTETTDELRTA